MSRFLAEGGYTLGRENLKTKEVFVVASNLANRAQALYEAETRSAKERGRTFVGYRQEEGKLVFAFFFRNGLQLPVFEVQS